MLKKGVTIVAIGHPYYGRMAFNLAKTIKAVDKLCPVQVIHNGGALNHIADRDKWVFDYLTYTDIQNGFMCKLYIDTLSEFDECILIDADCAWVSKQSPIVLIEQLAQKCEFTGITEGFYDVAAPEKSDQSKKYYFWADMQEIIRVYDLKTIVYQWRSEFMFIKRGELTGKLFETSRTVYDEAKEKLSTIQLFAHSVPDELALNIAASIHGIWPHAYKWQPTYWHRLYAENHQQIEGLASNYYALSCGSNVTASNVKKLYDRIVKAASYKLGLQHVFQLINKREMMPHRQQM